MLKVNWKKKLIVMMLIFTLTFADFALVSKTFAASIFDVFSNSEGDTGSVNVEFDANFVISQETEETEEVLENSEEDEEETEVTETTENTVLNETSEQAEENAVSNETETTETTEETEEDEELKEVKADVNTNRLNVSLSVKVSNSGYLKDAKIILGNGEELNFAINKDDFENSSVQSFEDETVELVQLNADSEVQISFPIYYEQSSYVQESNITKTNVIRFEGTYVDDEEEISVSKEVELTLGWQNERETSVSSEITKYISYTSDGVSGVILQMLIKADNTTEENTLPVKSSTVDIDVPTINGVKPESINVVANSLLATTGKENDSVEFSEENWNYDSENNILNITVENKAELVSLQNENEVLVDETAEEVEAYYAGSGVDEYLVTYIYNDVSLENVSINSGITSTFNMFGDTSSASVEAKVYELTEEIGDIATLSTSTNTTSISKAYTYLNYNNEENKYEIEVDNNLIFNISYKDIVTGLYYEDSGVYYITNSGESIEQNDLYYKSLKISQSNFNEILGEDGYVNVYNSDGTLLVTINSSSEVNEDGNYEINFDSSLKGIKIETSGPIAEGNLIFTTVRAYQDTSFDKETFKTFDKIQMNSIAKAKYTYVEDYVDCGTSTSEVTLENTTTNATLSIGQESLSTLAENSNVEIRIEFNNDKITSDVYGESEFIVKMPEYIDTFEVTDYSIVYGEGLEISNIEGYEENGSIYLKINVSGTQTSLSSGIVSNGTNIIMNANIKVNLYAPATTQNFELTYTNNEATTYANEKDGIGYSSVSVKYSAPSGVVSVNSISDYNDAGDTVTSVKQGTVIGDLDLYSSSKTATMELTIMNNQENSISDLVILGRTIFAGNTDIETGDDLGTTLDAPMSSSITGSDGFTIYYSTNGNAGTDLDNSENGWTTSVSDWSQVKSYLIVPNNSNYELGSAEKIRFSYEFTIPEDLTHNEDFYGTYATYYTNNTDVATVSGISVADLVGLSTGAGPELEVSTSVSETSVKQYQEFEMTTVVKNVGEGSAKNVVVTIPVSSGISYVKSDVDDDVVIGSSSDSITYIINEISAQSEISIITIFQADGSTDADTDEDDEEHEDEITLYATVTADDLGTTIETDKMEIEIEEAEILISIYDSYTISGTTLQEGDEIKFTVNVTNWTDDELTNVNVSVYIEDPLVVTYLSELDENDQLASVGEYDEATRTYSWTIDSLEARSTNDYHFKLEVGTLTGTELLKEMSFSVKAQADGTDEYSSSSIDFYVGKASLIITQVSTTTNSYINEGDTIEYVFSITNEGTVSAKDVVLTDTVPEGLIVKQIKYKVGDSEVIQATSETEEATATMSIDAGETKEVTIVAQAQTLNGVQELSVTNVGSVTSGSSTVTSNSVTHIVESLGLSSVTTTSSTGTASSSTTTSSNLVKTYSISGVAWVDSNENGARDDDEELIKGITATLVDSDSGSIKQTATTNSSGEYKFTGVSNGNYIVIFDYDTVAYTVTTYQKENVASNINSDVITTKIEQDGEYRNGAVSGTVTVSDVSVSNIDIGLVEAMKFDLSLDVGITKITVQNSQGTSTKTYDSLTYTKTEISQRYLSGSEIYIEYTFTVTNEGEVEGYATSIVDYIPEGMNFNSSLNSDWYTGNDGNLYTTVLQDTEIAAGETKTFTLVLSKTMTDENTGTVSNTAEIAGDYNIYGISDYDSTPGNNNQSEDDFARADSILSVGTGGIYIYISIFIATALLVGTAVTVIVIKRKSKALEGGV